MENRGKIIARTSILGIVANLLIASVKVVVGAMASSIAIISEGVNNATDALTSVLTLVGTKLAGRHPDAKHPFGYGRLEYLTSLVIATLILVSGVEMLISSVKLVCKPEALSISYVSLAVVAVSAVAKLVLGLYTIAMGKKAESTALEAVGIDCRNDSVVSVVTIASAVVFLVWHRSIDAYAGIFTSLLIVKSGVGVLMATVSELLGRAGDKELANRLYHRIRSTKGIVGAVDMMLHNYGPNAWSGSVNVEIDHDMPVGDAYAVLHALQMQIKREERVTMVFGVYAVGDDHDDVKRARRVIGEFARAREHIRSFHAVYLEPSTNRLYCDFIVDYALRDWDGLRDDFLGYMAKHYPDKDVILTIETEFV